MSDQEQQDAPTIASVQRELTGKELALRHFGYEHLRHGELREISMQVAALAESMYLSLGSGAEKSAGMRKLLEAKDCFVRQALVDGDLP